MSTGPAGRPTRARLRGSVWVALAGLLLSVSPGVAQQATEEVESGVSFRIRGAPSVIDVGGPAQPQCRPVCEAPKVCQCTCDRQDCEPDEPTDDCGSCRCECL